MRVVDTHVHIWPRPRPERRFPWTSAHPVETLFEVLDANGVDAAVQVTPSPEGWDNEYGIEAAVAHPGRLAVFGRFDPAAPDPERRLEAWMARPGASGVRLTAFGDSALGPGGLTAFEDFWAAAERTGVTVALFAPDDLADAVGVLDRHPQLHLIVDHLGVGAYPGCRDPLAGLRVLPELAAFPNVSAKVAALPEVSSQPFPFADMHEHLATALDLFGAGRLVWGSNHPVITEWCTYAESLDWLEACDFLSDADRASLLHGTADAMLARAAVSPSGPPCPGS
jgi:predicted TIM-barrel fold metal-dependent hydrolase